MLTRLLLLTMLIAMQSVAISQTLIRGRVTDRQSGQPLAMASARLLRLPDSTQAVASLTDSTGKFQLMSFSDSSYLVHLSMRGYEDMYRQVMLTNLPSELVLDTLTLLPAAAMLGEVTVAGERSGIKLTGERLVVNVSGNTLFKTAANAFDVLKKIPGLEVGPDGSLLISGRNVPTVFINGKPTPMSADELQNYLSGLSSEMIASVEVIANPSARYEGEHKGIVDIRLKPRRTVGWNGSISTNMQQNAYFYADHNLALNYKAKKFAYTARLGYSHGTKIYRFEGLQHLANTNQMATRTKTLTANNNYNYQLGAEYAPSARHRFNLSLRANRINRDVGAFNTLNTKDATGQNQVSFISSNNRFDPRLYTHAADISYDLTGTKSSLQVIGSLASITNDRREDIRNRNTIADTLIDHWKTDLTNEILIRFIQADYSTSFAKGKWSIGARMAATTTRNDLIYDTLNRSRVFVRDSGRSNNFHYEEKIAAIYTGYERQIKKITYSASLRLEHTRSIADAITLKEFTRRKYLTWLPSLSVTWQATEKSTYRLYYTRRMTRPNFVQLNPFRFYNSPLNYVVGNPYLQPSVTDAAGITYNSKLFTLSATVGRERSPMARYPEYDPVTNVLEFLGRNLPYNDFATIEFSLPLSITKWWKTNHNLGGNYKKEQTPYHDVTYRIPVTDFVISGTQVFTLPRGFTADLYYYYRSRSGSGLYIAKPVTNIDIGIQRKWLGDKLNTRLNVYDIFDTYRNSFIFREKSIIDNEFYHWYGVRRVALSILYNFGQSRHKTNMIKKGEEENRAGM